MVELIIHELSKKFGNQLLFSNFSQTFKTGECIAITGTNGSGKSTFLQILSGYTQPGSGEIVLLENGKKINKGEYYKKMAFAAPYLDLPGELSIREVFLLHQSLGMIKSEIGETEMLQMANAIFYADRPMKYFSSGMLQRTKLTLAFSSSGAILFLDEPLSNLDILASNWFIKELSNQIKNRLVFIASNHVDGEIALATRKINLPDFVFPK
jgi:ABC-type multidrug transport system ATPase subunit